MHREVYLDNSATTRPFDEVIEYMDFINKKTYGNPSSVHLKGIEAEKELKLAREIIANSLGVNSKQIYFTSGGTESNNMSIFGYLKANLRKGKHIITTKIEHPSVLEVYKYLEKEGYSVDYIDVDENGIVLLEMLENRIKDDTSLISVMHTNNETGAIQPIDEIVKIRNKCNKNTVIHVDAVQAYGKLKLNPKISGIDLLTISAHKIHGPKGVGAIYVNSDVKIQPIIFGGGQESSMRSGTENVAGIGGFGIAAKIMNGNINKNLKKVIDLKTTFIEMLKANFTDYGIISPENSSPYILSIYFSNIKAEVLLHHLEIQGIYVSTGSACSSHKPKNKQSHVLLAMGLKQSAIEGAIRISFSEQNEIEDIKYTIENLKNIISKLR